MGDELKSYAAKRKRNRRIRIVLIAVLVLSLLIGAWYLLSRNFFVVKAYTVSESKLYSSESIWEKVAIPMDTPLHAVSKKDVIRTVEENFPYLVDVEVEFDLPQTVCIRFRENFGELAVRLGGELFAVDSEMKVLAKETPDTEISRIDLQASDISRCIVGETLQFYDENTGSVLNDLIYTLQASGMLPNTDRIDIRDKFHIRLTYLDRFEILLGDGTDFRYKLAMARSVIKDLSSEAKGEIDVTDPNLAYVKLEEGEF